MNAVGGSLQACGLSALQLPADRSAGNDTALDARRSQDRPADPATWPRDEQRQVLWSAAAPGVLVARLPAAKPAWEPIIVTTLRRYARRGAPTSLLHRIAGSAAHYRTLVEVWDLDGRALRRAMRLLPEETPVARERRQLGDGGALGVVLSIPERRLALFQIIADYARAGVVMPTTARLARFFAVSPGTIDNDIDVLRGEGRIACAASCEVRGGHRRSLRVVETGAVGP